jgi:nicotinate-nucleotide adenylyltransferase
VSSTEVRERVRAGKSIRGFVPDAVAAYIARAGLYR